MPVLAKFSPSLNFQYVEKVFLTNRNPNDVYVPLDSLILKKNPQLHVANFFALAITIQICQVLGKGHKPKSRLDCIEKCSPKNQQKSYVHARVI